MIEISENRLALLTKLRERRAAQEQDVTAVVRGILDDVKRRGDEAVFEYTKKFDGAALSGLRVAESEIKAACDLVGADYMQMLEEAAANIRAFHKKQVRQGFVMAEQPGVVMGQRILPLGSVGIYVPGGTAAYPSTVLMDAIPAAIAGVRRIVMVSPPGADGSLPAHVLAAAKVAGVTEIYKMGGAQAVAALAYGTQSAPNVDKIVGPGNIYVATAKQLVYGLVDIDMIAGPSDILVVADESANPVWVAADMLGQAEHDVNASAVLATSSRKLAEEVQAELARQLPKLPRKEIAEKALRANGYIYVCDTMDEAVSFANVVAPEHLELCVEDPFALLPLVQNAGSVFLGHNTPEALGDYYAGPNHTLPTGGTARFSSPLGVDDFVKRSSYLYYSAEALAKAAPQVQNFANSEGLQAHANSVTLRIDPEKAL